MSGVHLPRPRNTYSIPEFSDALTSKLGKAFSCSLNKFFFKEQQSVCLRGKTTVEPNVSKELKVLFPWKPNPFLLFVHIFL